MIVISGPTATGKTKLALQLAAEFNGELISADSRQIYIGMDIGTGKDIEGGAWDKKNKTWIIDKTPIHMLDQILPSSNYNVAQYISGAGEAIGKIKSRGHLPILVGGTGFYIRSIINPPATLGIPQNNNLRSELDTKTREDLQKILQKIDLVKFNSMNYSDQNNPRRLVRAIEVAKYGKNPQGKVSSGRVFQISLTAPLPYIYKLADQRIDEMIKVGLIEEITNLLKKYSWEDPGLKSIGYIEFKEYFEKKKTLEKCVQQLKFNHHSLIRRQITWFKKEKNINLIDISKKDILLKAKNFLKIAFGSP